MEYEGNSYKYLKREKYRGYEIEYYTTETSNISHFLARIPLDDNKRYPDRSYEDVRDYAIKEIDRLLPSKVARDYEHNNPRQRDEHR